MVTEEHLVTISINHWYVGNDEPQVSTTIIGTFDEVPYVSFIIELVKNLDIVSYSDYKWSDMETRLTKQSFLLEDEMRFMDVVFNVYKIPHYVHDSQTI